MWQQPDFIHTVRLFAFFHKGVWEKDYRRVDKISCIAAAAAATKTSYIS
jgi:hypothetical protein